MARVTTRCDERLSARSYSGSSKDSQWLVQPMAPTNQISKRRHVFDAIHDELDIPSHRGKIGRVAGRPRHQTIDSDHTKAAHRQVTTDITADETGPAEDQSARHQMLVFDCRDLTSKSCFANS